MGRRGRRRGHPRPERRPAIRREGSPHRPLRPAPGRPRPRLLPRSQPDRPAGLPRRLPHRPDDGGVSPLAGARAGERRPPSSTRSASSASVPPTVPTSRVWRRRSKARACPSPAAGPTECRACGSGRARARCSCPRRAGWRRTRRSPPPTPSPSRRASSTCPRRRRTSTASTGWRSAPDRGFGGSGPRRRCGSPSRPPRSSTDRRTGRSGSRTARTCFTAFPGGKVGVHRPGPETDPDDPSRTPPPEMLRAIRDFASRRLGIEATLSGATGCLYAVTPDEGFRFHRADARDPRRLRVQRGTASSSVPGSACGSRRRLRGEPRVASRYPSPMLLLPALALQATTVDLFRGAPIGDPGYWAVADTYLDKAEPTQDHGGGFTLLGGDGRTVMLRFGDLSRAVGAGRRVVAATLVLTPSGGDVPQLKGVTAVDAPWGEGAAGHAHPHPRDRRGEARREEGGARRARRGDLERAARGDRRLAHARHAGRRGGDRDDRAQGTDGGDRRPGADRAGLARSTVDRPRPRPGLRGRRRVLQQPVAQRSSAARPDHRADDDDPGDPARPRGRRDRQDVREVGRHRAERRHRLRARRPRDLDRRWQAPDRGVGPRRSRPARRRPWPTADPSRRTTSRFRTSPSASRPLPATRRRRTTGSTCSPPGDRSRSGSGRASIRRRSSPTGTAPSPPRAASPSRRTESADGYVWRRRRSRRTARRPSPRGCGRSGRRSACRVPPPGATSTPASWATATPGSRAPFPARSPCPTSRTPIRPPRPALLEPTGLSPRPTWAA